VNGADNSRHDCPCDFGNVRSRAASKGVLPTGPWRVHDRDELRHAKLWFAGKQNNWDLAAYEIDEIKEGLEDAARLHPTFDGVPVAEMIKTIIDPRIEELEKAVRAKSSAKFSVAFDELTSGCNSCLAGANKPFIRIQRPTAFPLTNQNFAPEK
jgi:hypothetical protein